MIKGRWVQSAAVVVAVLCVLGSTLLVAPINQRRVDLQIVHESRFGDAPKYALLAASLGTFRGIAADFLWYRAEKLKSEGKLFEANTTAGWITTLQPRFGQVWVFQSWNMAYNISVLTHTPEERWDWVNKGIKILRDEGIVYNPTNIAIYRQLAWTFFHKIGQRTDDMNRYYKARLAEEWQELLGTPTEGATTEVALERFKPIADAADLYFSEELDTKNVRDPLTHLYGVHPQTRGLVSRLREIGFEPDQEGLRAYGRIVMYQRYIQPDTSYADDRYNKLSDLMGDPRYADIFEEQLLPYLRAKVLIEDYHMSPRRMYDLMVKFGPMDWRHAGSQACYWGATGVEMAGELKDKTKIDILNTDRQVIHAMQMLMNSGSISYNPISGQIDTVPDPRFIDSYGDAMVEANKRQVSIDWAGGGNEQAFKQGHENFLLRAILYAYLYGDVEKSQAYYTKLRDLYGKEPHNVYSGRYKLNLQDLIVTELREDWQMTDQVARPLIESLLIQAFREGLLLARYDTYQRYIEIARNFEKKLVEEKKYDNPTADGGQGRLIDWESFKQLVDETYIKYMRSPGFDLLERSRVYNNTPLPLQVATYADFRDAVASHAEAQGYGNIVDRMFPPPPKPESEGGGDKVPLLDKPADRGTIERK
jgi:hypothetical protein